MKPSGSPPLLTYFRLLLSAVALFVSLQNAYAQYGGPGAVTTFSPAQGAIGVNLTPVLTWGAASGATSYNVYFGASATPPFVGTTAGTTYSPGNLNPNTTYYWYLISEGPSGATQSFIWYFTTGAASSGPPAAVTVFSPGQGATNVSVTPTITWGVATGATSYDVYFGTASMPPFVTNTTATSYTPPALSPNTTYNWFLISRNSSGTTTSFPWFFTTGAATSHPAFFTGEVSVGSGVYYLQLPNGNVFGYYNYQFFPVIYHYDLGFESFLDANDGKSGAFLYDFASGHWFYTSPSYPFPYLYDFTLQAILYYFPNTANAGHYTSNPRYFYNFATGMTITM
jgi:hypothetical protein